MRFLNSFWFKITLLARILKLKKLENRNQKLQKETKKT